MPRYRGDEIPPVSDYAHWGEEAQTMWYAENKYDMDNAGEPIDDFFDDSDDDWCEEHQQSDCGEDHNNPEKGPFDD